MGKRFKKLLLGLSILSMPLTLSSCLPEHFIDVRFYDYDDSLVFERRIGLHQDCIAPEIETFYLGHKFMGWGFEKDQATSSFRARSILHYNVAKPHLNNGFVDCYAVYREMQEVCIGYEGRSSLSTLTEDYVNNILIPNVNDYVKSFDEYKDVTIRFKNYSYNNDGTERTTAEIASLVEYENIADVLIGFGSNFNTVTDSAGKTIIKTCLAKDNIYLNGKPDRYIYRRDSFDLTMLIYDYFLGKPVERKNFEYDCVIGWLARETTSKLNQEKMDHYVIQAQEMLRNKGYGDRILLRPYVEMNEDLKEAILADGDCDILLGFGVNINMSSGANLEIPNSRKFTFVVEDTTRYLVQVVDSKYSIVKEIIDWTIKNSPKIFELPTESE